MKNKKYLLAISGGPDSMFLLDKYKNKNIVVAHVNYNKREDSFKDETVVKDFCLKHNIKFEILSVDKNTIPESNFQDWARKVRYDFFKKVYSENNCSVLITAHHKDDFLETAWMQMNSNRTPRYFGIRKKTILNGMNIFRPFVDFYWKNEILEYLFKKNITYAIDVTNEQPIFTRNIVRKELSILTEREKESRYSWFVMSNKILVKKFKRVDKNFVKWKENDFSILFFKKFLRDREEIIYEYLHYKFGSDIKVSKNKIEGLIQFILGIEGNKIFEIDSNHFIKKQNKKLI